MRIAHQSGVILIQVAFSALVLVGLSAFAVDLGAAWYARAQAQTAADAGAIAGAQALALDDQTWPFPTSGIVVDSATTVANANGIMNASGTPEVLAECPDFPPYNVAPSNTHCVRVNVYRDGAHNNSFGSYFANVFGVSSQSVLATATAKVLPANSFGCMRPWFIPDKWTDTDGDLTVDPGEFTTGYVLPDDIGDPVTFHPQQGPSAYGQLALPVGGTNGQVDSILHCASGAQFYIGQTNVATEPGAHNGQKNAVEALIDDIDPGATYDPATNTVQGSCAESGTCDCAIGGSPGPCPYNGTMSPRIIQAAVCDPTWMDCAGERTPPGGPGVITITKILSFFLTGYDFTAGELHIHGRLIGAAGDIHPTGTEGSVTNSTLYAVRLIR